MTDSKTIQNNFLSRETKQLIDLLASKQEGDRIFVEAGEWGNHTIRLIKKEDLDWYTRAMIVWDGNRERLEEVISRAFAEIELLNLKEDYTLSPALLGDFVRTLSKGLMQAQKIGNEIIDRTEEEERKRLELIQTVNSLLCSESASVIQRCFRAFSSRKKLIAQVGRLSAASLRQKQQPKETPLFVSEVASKEAAGFVLGKFQIWNSAASHVVTKDEKEGAFVSQNKTINDLLESNLKNLESAKAEAENTTFKLIFDKQGNVQASALFKSGQTRLAGSGAEAQTAIPLYISLLSTAPWNLRISANEKDERRVEGAATALVEAAIYLSIKKGYKGAVALEAVSGAVAFYEKLGFVRAAWIPNESGLEPMELSEEVAKNFLASNRAGRAIPSEGIDVPVDSNTGAKNKKFRSIEGELQKIQIFQENGDLVGKQQLQSACNQLKDLELRLTQMQVADQTVETKIISIYSHILESNIQECLEEIKYKICEVEHYLNRG